MSDVLVELSHVRLVRRGRHSFEVRRVLDNDLVADYVTEEGARFGLPDWNAVIKQEQAQLAQEQSDREIGSKMQ